MFDVTDRQSFIKLSEWMFELELYCQSQPVVLLIGNKSDLSDKRIVSKSEAMEFAIKHNILYVETSALINQEVEYAFEVLTEEILAKPELLECNSRNVDQTIRIGQECRESQPILSPATHQRKKCC